VPASVTLSTTGVVSKVASAVWNTSSVDGIRFSVSATKSNGGRVFTVFGNSLCSYINISVND